MLLDQNDERVLATDSVLLRGGFNIGEVPGLPFSSSISGIQYNGAKLRLTWAQTKNRRYLTPNVARDRLSESHYIAERVLQLWLTYLLQNVDLLSSDLALNLEYQGGIIRPWLEQFSALNIYRLASKDWQWMLRSAGLPEDALESWEAGKGESLLCKSYGIAGELLSLVLPRITDRELKAARYHVFIPKENWRSTLENCHDFIRHRVSWNLFCKFGPQINGFIQYSHHYTLNSEYKDRFASWDEEDLKTLANLLRRVPHGVGLPMKIDSSESSIFAEGSRSLVISK